MSNRTRLNSKEKTGGQMAGGKRKSQPNKTNSVSSNQSEEHFNESDRIVLYEINQTMKHLKEEMKILKFEYAKQKKNKKTVQVKKENERINQAINLNIFANNDLDQYNRRENIRICGVPEISGEKDDGEDVLFQIAEELNIELDEWDIQKCHRQGKKSFSRNKTNAGSYSKKNPLPIIERFFSFKKRKKFLFSKSMLKTSKRFPTIYLTKNLTQLRY